MKCQSYGISPLSRKPLKNSEYSSFTSIVSISQAILVKAGYSDRVAKNREGRAQFLLMFLLIVMYLVMVYLARDRYYLYLGYLLFEFDRRPVRQQLRRTLHDRRCSEA